MASPYPPTSYHASIHHYAHSLASLLDRFLATLRALPGSDMVLRYIRSSYQNDPVRSVIELGLVIFLTVYVLSARFSAADKEGRVVRLSEEEIDEMVAEWTPEPLVGELSEQEKKEIEKGDGGEKSCVIVG